VTEQQHDQPSDQKDAGQGRETIGLDRDDKDHDFVDKSKIDFDPDEGLYSGTAVDGSSEIPGPHQDGETGEVDMDEVKQQANDAESGPERQDPGDRAGTSGDDGEPMPDPGPHQPST
jgi:hypothetical protein